MPIISLLFRRAPRVLQLSLVGVIAPAVFAQTDAPTPASVATVAAPYIFSSRRAYVAPELPDASPEWVTKSFAWADIIFDAFPPSINESPARRAALMRLDDIFHLADAPARPQVKAFLQSRVEKALHGMEAATNDHQPQIWKLYNDGFVVRVDGVTYGFDLIPGVPGGQGGGRARSGAPSQPGATAASVAPRPPAMPPRDCSMTDAQRQRLVAQVDVLFISHLHGDHANQQMAAAFLAASKPVVVPPELWKDTDLAAKLIYAPRSTTEDFTVSIPGKTATLRVLAFPGHQGPVLNNVYLVTTPDGFTVMHTGDQSIPETTGKDFDWLDKIGSEHKVHILFTDCWYPDVKRLIRSVNPDLVVTGHENELGHAIDHREDYAQTYERLFGSPYPFVLMTWGESFAFQNQAPFLFNK